VYLSAILITGLTPEPAIEDYFKRDLNGIFGSTWMQQHLTCKIWHQFHVHTHFDPNEIMKQFNINIKSC